MQNFGLGIFGASQLIAAIPGHALIVNSNSNSFNEILDFNGDGRGDLINLEEYCDTYPPYGELCTPRWTILVSTGASYAVGAQLQGDIIFTGDVAQVVPVDVNGDGADDVLYYTGFAGGTGYWSLMQSTGVGFGSAASVGIPYGVATMAGTDYDNDGRDDLIVTDGNYLRVYRSNGSTYPSLTESLYSPVAGAPYVADFTGDGFADILRAGSNWHIHKHQSALPDVVTAFSDGLGYNVGVQYESLSNSASYTFNPLYGAWPYIGYLVRTRYVVTAENHDDGIGGLRTYTHQYDTASMDASGRGWQSFHGHRVNDLDHGTYTATYFEQAFPFAGIVTSQELRRSSNDALIRKVENTPAETVFSTTTPHRRFVRIEDTTVREYEFQGPVPSVGTELRKIEENPTYNTDFGYVTQLLRKVTEPDTGAVWQASVNFDPTRYETPWCLGLPGLVITENTLPAPNNTPLQRKVRHTFNPTTCKPTDVQDESESDPQKQLKTHYDYNAYGNVTAVSQDSVSTTQPRSMSFLYADGHEQLPTSMTVAGVNLETTLTWDYRTGQRATVTSPDGLQTSWDYDNFGRVVRETSPAGTTTVRYEDCYYCWPAHARFSMHSQGSDGSDAYGFFDELGRPVGSADTLPLGNPARREIRYNDQGQVAQASQPYVYYDPAYWTTYEYDLLGRIKKENAPVSEASPSGAETIYEYPGRDVWVTDAENHTTKYLHNAAGQIRQVIDALSGTTAYTYRPFGELATVTDAASNVTTIGYDARGHKASLADPNMGSWAYEHNAHGELRRQRSPMTSAPSWTVTLTYDAGGRLSTREESEGTTTFTYHPSGLGAKGKVDTISGPGHALKYSYHPDHGLPTQIRHTLDGTNYFYDMTFDSEARLNVLTYPESTSGYRFKVDYDYDPFGHLTAAKDGNAPSTVFYRLDEVDALGREVLAHFGNGLDEQHDFDRASLSLKTIKTGPSFGTSIQNLEFTHDEVGNVLSRQNANIGKAETFTYDALNRLKTTQVSGLAQNVIEYDGNGVGVGRITSRTDVGAYVYTGGCGGGPNAVKSAAGLNYCYDAAGRMTSRGGSNNTIGWTSHDLPSWIRWGSQTDELSYGVDRARYKQVRMTASTIDATILYVGGLLERETTPSTDTWRHFVSVSGRTVAKVERVNTTNTTQYLHRDHQSSVVEITSDTGTPVQSLAYDPWGLRRNAATWAPLGSPFSGAPGFKRGYTGHEHLDNVELIHMNGRVQDPRLGTFISADPFVQAPYHSQSLNRYSYVWNNPLTLVDPSGFQGTADDRGEEQDGQWVCIVFNLSCPFVTVVPVDQPGNTFVGGTPPDQGGYSGVPQGGVTNGGPPDIGTLFGISSASAQELARISYDPEFQEAFERVQATRRGAEIVESIRMRSGGVTIQKGTTGLRNLPVRVGMAQTLPPSGRSLLDVLLRRPPSPLVGVITINLQTRNPRFIDVDERPFRPSLERILAHELGHLYALIVRDVPLMDPFNDQLAIDLENEISRQMGDPIVRHPTLGHESGF